MRFDCKTDAPLLIVMGQSNAHGHGTRLPAEEELNTPLSNVLGLACAQNQAYGLSSVTWSGFVTHDMNLGETQNHTYCLAEGVARAWQARTDAGEPLPPLRIIQISIGSQGVAQEESFGLNMWWPQRPPVLRPGPPDIDISLYPLAVQIFSLAVQGLRESGKTPRVLGLHWNQWETEVQTGGAVLQAAEQNYRSLFEGFQKALGGQYPLYLYHPLARVYQNPEGLVFMAALFARFAAADSNVRLINPTLAPGYDASRDDQGIFQSDCVHYSPAIQRWFASEQLRDIFD